MSKKQHICEKVQEILVCEMAPDIYPISYAEKELRNSHLSVCEECRGFFWYLIERMLKERFKDDIQALLNRNIQRDNQI